MQEISISEQALGHIKNQLELTGSNYLRLGVKESGCNGYMYTLDFLDSPEASDQHFDFDEDVRVCVAQSDLELVLGTEVDLITQGLNSAMVFKNPNATSYCGCGESFAVSPDTEPSVNTDVTGLATDAGPQKSP